jgi:hypothetical protein
MSNVQIAEISTGHQRNGIYDITGFFKDTDISIFVGVIKGFSKAKTVVIFKDTCSPN